MRMRRRRRHLSEKGAHEGGKHKVQGSSVKGGGITGGKEPEEK